MRAQILYIYKFKQIATFLQYSTYTTQTVLYHIE